MMLPRHGQAAGLAARRHGEASGELPYERLAPSWRLPTAVDWRGTGADGLVKDQATCGSCWAFGATAALQGAYWAATGEDPLQPGHLDRARPAIPGHGRATAFRLDKVHPGHAPKGRETVQAGLVVVASEASKESSRLAN